MSLYFSSKHFFHGPESGGSHSGEELLPNIDLSSGLESLQAELTGNQDAQNLSQAIDAQIHAVDEKADQAIQTMKEDPLKGIRDIEVAKEKDAFLHNLEGVLQSLVQNAGDTVRNTVSTERLANTMQFLRKELEGLKTEDFTRLDIPRTDPQNVLDTRKLQSAIAEKVAAKIATLNFGMPETAYGKDTKFLENRRALTEWVKNGMTGNLRFAPGKPMENKESGLQSQLLNTMRDKIRQAPLQKTPGPFTIEQANALFKSTKKIDWSGSAQTFGETIIGNDDQNRVTFQQAVLKDGGPQWITKNNTVIGFKAQFVADGPIQDAYLQRAPGTSYKILNLDETSFRALGDKLATPAGAKEYVDALGAYIATRTSDRQVVLYERDKDALTKIPQNTQNTAASTTSQRPTQGRMTGARARSTPPLKSTPPVEPATPVNIPQETTEALETDVQKLENAEQALLQSHLINPSKIDTTKRQAVIDAAKQMAATNSTDVGALNKAIEEAYNAPNLLTLQKIRSEIRNIPW